MKSVVTSLLVLFLALSVQACASTGMASQTGPSLVTVVSEGGHATDNPATSRTGKACSYNIMGLLTVGDSSVDKAKMDGDVVSVSSVDREYLNILFFYGRACTVVKGGGGY